MAKPNKRVPKHLAEYRRERRRIQQQIYRRKKAGYVFKDEDIQLPEFKKIPTKRDVERLKKSWSAEKIAKKAMWVEPETGEVFEGKKAQIVKGMTERRERKMTKTAGPAVSVGQHGEKGRGQGGGHRKSDKKQKTPKQPGPEPPQIEGPKPEVPEDYVPKQKRVYTDPETGEVKIVYIDPETGEVTDAPDEGELEGLPWAPAGAPPKDELELVYNNFLSRVENFNIDPNLHPKAIRAIYEAQYAMLNGLQPFDWAVAIRVYENQERLEAAIRIIENYEEGFYQAFEEFISTVTGAPVPLEWLAYYEYERGDFATYD